MNKSMIYARVASNEQASGKLEEQINLCNQFAADNELTVYAVYKDVIGTHIPDKRFNDILEEMIINDVEDLIVQDLSRISRNSIKVLELVQKFTEQGKNIISVV
ncbi:hypothetical protein GCM10023310_70100 [Paenibacillus vulneris]|uniref:Recombinase family protein n=1 Tax=Paenibacillus vulneris TaxID=1133364 RepID=A0ABW3UF32_9BACL